MRYRTETCQLPSRRDLTAIQQNSRGVTHIPITFFGICDSMDDLRLLQLKVSIDSELNSGSVSEPENQLLPAPASPLSAAFCSSYHCPNPLDMICVLSKRDSVNNKRTLCLVVRSICRCPSNGHHLSSRHLASHQQAHAPMNIFFASLKTMFCEIYQL